MPPLAGILLLCSLPILIFLGIYWHWKVYGLYRRLGPQVRDIGYYWFSFQFQTPNMARQLPGYVDFSSLMPEESLEQMGSVRRQARRITTAMLLWIIAAVVLFVISGNQSS
jgi:hypothetical protein